MLDKNVSLGQFVISKQGRDKDEVYLVYSKENNNFVKVVNGTTKTIKKAKLKNVCHLILTPHCDNEIANKLLSQQKINDQMIHHAIHMYQKQPKEVK